MKWENRDTKVGQQANISKFSKLVNFESFSHEALVDIVQS